MSFPLGVYLRSLKSVAISSVVILKAYLVNESAAFVDTEFTR